MRKFFWLFAAVLLAVVVGVYAQTGVFEQLSYDDDGYTVGCQFVRGGLSAANVLEAFRNVTWGGIYMPVTYASYMATISVFGQSTGAQHLVSVAIHCLNALLFFAFLADLYSRRAPLSRSALALCFFGAALWAVHPLRVESVAWIASRKDVVFTLFALLGLFAWMRGRVVLTFFLMLLSCLSKPTAMVFPALALSVELLLLPGEGLEPVVRKMREPRFWLKYVPLFLLALATALLATYSQTHGDGEAARPLFIASFGWRCFNALVSLGLYFYHFVVPVGLQFWYRPVRDGVPLHAALGVVSFLLAFVAWCVAVRRCRSLRRELVVAAFWFAAAIGPTLGIAASFGNHAFADRFTYVPMMAVSLLFVLARFRLTTAVASFSALVLVVLSVLSFGYAATYRNNLTAFEQVVRNDPEHCYAWTNIGGETILRTGDFEKGIAFLRKSLAIFRTEEAEDELVHALVSRNNPKDEQEIVDLCMKHVDWSTSSKEGEIPLIPETKDKDGFLSEALGIVSTRHADWPNAVRCFDAAWLRGGREDCRMRLAMCYWNMRQYDKAAEHLLPLSLSSRPDISTKAKELLGSVHHQSQSR